MRTDARPTRNDDHAPVEWFRSIRSLSDVEPERQLMMAVLEDAVYCVWTYCNATDRRGRELFLAEKRWMLSSDRSSFFCFENICETLGLDPGHIRQSTLP